MKRNTIEENIRISPEAKKIIALLLSENAPLRSILQSSETFYDFQHLLKEWAWEHLEENPPAFAYYKGENRGRAGYNQLRWSDFSAIRMLDYINHSGLEYKDLNLNGKEEVCHPFKILWLAIKQGVGGASPAFLYDMIYLFRQLSGKEQGALFHSRNIRTWMDKHPSGLDEEIVKRRNANKRRIIENLIQKLDKGEITSRKYFFKEGITLEEKREQMSEWWNEPGFHLRFAVRGPQMLNELLNYSLETDTMRVLEEAKNAGIPFFINPYYLSLLDVDDDGKYIGEDLAIRDYILYSKELVNEFGKIVAWEKEDIVKSGEPNAAGWILPSEHNIHRRYPEVAILIPDSMGRACGGLCSSCQRMYDFERGNLNFDLEKLKPKESWQHKLERLLKYFEEDPQLCDILITGGDALMSSDRTLEKILDAVYQMAVRKIEANKNRPEGEKYSEITRIRLGTRLPAYLPQRITYGLTEILRRFKEKASHIGVKQFIIQTHFESAMEITPEAKRGVHRLTSIGWMVTNQLVFTAAASRRGHTAKLRKVLNDIGVITYYTFTVKGYMENYHNFAPNARAVQEQIEEKSAGIIKSEHIHELKNLHKHTNSIQKKINELREKNKVPFLATDRNVINLPGVGKSLTFRTIGITRKGRRILEFDYDATRNHSPIIDQMGKVLIVESKPIMEYLHQLEKMGEDVSEYETIWGYSIGETETRYPIFEYPEHNFTVTLNMKNLQKSLIR